MSPANCKSFSAPAPPQPGLPPSLRPQAEGKLQPRAIPDQDPSFPEDRWGLIYELQTHQIELEIQNEELQRSQMEGDFARARYFDLYDLAPVGYITLCEAGLIQEVNRTAATMLRVNRTFLCNRPLKQFVFSDDHPNFLSNWQQLLESHTPRNWTMRLVTAKSTAFWVLVQALMGRSGDFRLTFNDISEYKNGLLP